MFFAALGFLTARPPLSLLMASPPPAGPPAAPVLLRSVRPVRRGRGAHRPTQAGHPSARDPISREVRRPVRRGVTRTEDDGPGEVLGCAAPLAACTSGAPV